jgi:excisionase family DNA binding protein
MPRLYDTISGQRIEYPDPSPELEAFLARVRGMADDKKKTQADLITLIYSKENPLLDHSIFPERGAVTKEVLENPVYALLQDLLFRKQVQEEKLDVEKIAARFSLTVSEAAERLKVHPTAITKAVKARRLAAWVKNGKLYLDPRSLEALTEVGRRGVPSRLVEPLSFRVGHEGDAMLRLKYAGSEGTAEPDSKTVPVEGTIERWRRVGVLHGRGGKLRLFVLEPGEEVSELTLAGLYVRGKFTYAEKVNNLKAARLAWETFRAV